MIEISRLRPVATKAILLALVLSILPIITPSMTPNASAATVTATGTNPSVCNQTVGNSDSVVAYRLSGGDCVVEFKRVGTTVWTSPTGVTRAGIVVVGGGGGGGVWVAGGGGGGGVTESISATVRPGTSNSIVVGNGGNGSSISIAGAISLGTNGETSSGLSVSASGGGLGASWTNAPGSSATGGGASGSGGGIGAVAGTGSNGGNGGAASGVSPTYYQYGYPGGGGGGAGGNGGDAVYSTSVRGIAGNGGIGETSSITGVSYGGGGGAGCHASGTWPCALGNGVNGGGNGGGYTGTSSVMGSFNAATSGTSNTGGGGGGAGTPNGGGYPTAARSGGSGGSGLVIIQYTPSSTPPSAPQNISQSLSGSSVNLSWSAPDSGSVTHYQIESSTTGTSWSVVDTVTASVTTYSVSSLLATSTYYFRVVAYWGTIAGTYGYPWTKIYGTTSKNRHSNGSIIYESGFGLGANDSANTVSSNFSRVRYLLNTTISNDTRSAEVDFYKWSTGNTDSATTLTVSPTIANLRIPSDSATQQFVVHANVTDLNVYSNNSSVTSGKNLLGRLELWNWNYTQAVSGLKPPGNASTYDFDDTPSSPGDYGSFQVHDLTNTKPVFVWNKHSSNQTAEIAYGRNPAAGYHPDWTFCSPPYNNGSCPSPSSFRLQIYVNTPLSVGDVTAPTLSTAVVPSAGNTLVMTFNETISATTAPASAFTVTRGGSETITITSVSVSGLTLTLNLGATIRVGQLITVSYSDPTASNDANAVQDSTGNDVASLSNVSVTNNSTVLNRLDTPTTLAVSSTETSTATFTFTNTTNASSHTLRLYDSATATLISTTTSFSSGSSRTGLTPATQYYATLQAVGDGVTYESSTASASLYFTTAIRKPVISSQPSDTATTATRSASFAVTATSPDAGTLSYQWQRSVDAGASYSNLSNGAGISGVTTTTLTLSSLTTAENSSRYRVIVTTTKVGVTDSETTTAATLTVNGAIALSGGSNISKEYFTAASSTAISASGGTGAISFSISGSTGGVTINTNSGVVTSDETTPRGTYSLTVTATDQSGATATQAITITVTQGTPTLSISLSATPRKGTALTLTATTSVAGTVRFLERGRVISGCKSRTATGGAMMSLGSRTATCTWKPRIHGPSTVSAILTPTSADYSSVSASQELVVLKRTASR